MTSGQFEKRVGGLAACGRRGSRWPQTRPPREFGVQKLPACRGARLAFSEKILATASRVGPAVQADKSAPGSRDRLMGRVHI
eukprot:5755240-Pyramimonas_sp.AAC.1